MIEKLQIEFKITKITVLIKRTAYVTKIREIQNIAPNSTSLVKKNDCNTKSTETENKIPDLTSLRTTPEFD